MCSSVSSSFYRGLQLQVLVCFFQFYRGLQIQQTHVCFIVVWEVYSFKCSSVHRCHIGLQFQVFLCSPVLQRFPVSSAFVFIGLTEISSFKCFSVYRCLTEVYSFKCFSVHCCVKWLQAYESSVSQLCYRSLQVQQVFVCFTFVLQRVTGSTSRQFRRCVTERYSPKY